MNAHNLLQPPVLTIDAKHAINQGSRLAADI